MLRFIRFILSLDFPFERFSAMSVLLSLCNFPSADLFVPDTAGSIRIPANEIYQILKMLFLFLDKTNWADFIATGKPYL